MFTLLFMKCLHQGPVWAKSGAEGIGELTGLPLTLGEPGANDRASDPHLPHPHPGL